MITVFLLSDLQAGQETLRIVDKAPDRAHPSAVYSTQEENSKGLLTWETWYVFGKGHNTDIGHGKDGSGSDKYVGDLCTVDKFKLSE